MSGGDSLLLKTPAYDKIANKYTHQELEDREQTVIDWYFAYGSNMNPKRMEARGLSFEQRISGRLSGFAMAFNKRAVGKEGVAYANVIYQAKGTVEGVLYRLSNQHAIELMDGYEGSPVRYSREVYVIDSPQGAVNAWVYVANKAMLGSGLLPEKQYVEHLLCGKGLISEAYYQWLCQHPVKKGVDLPKDYGLKFNG